MTVQTMNSNQIRQAGLKALLEALGPVGMIRFLQQFETGYGDYTKDRAAWLDKMDVRQIAKEIKLRRKEK